MRDHTYQEKQWKEKHIFAFMKMRNIFLFIAAVLSGTDIQAQTATADASHTVYVVDISARNLSLKAVDSYPQKLLAVIYHYDTIKTVRNQHVSTHTKTKNEGVP